MLAVLQGVDRVQVQHPPSIVLRKLNACRRILNRRVRGCGGETTKQKTLDPSRFVRPETAT